MKCPRYQQDNPSHAKFCLECGVPFGGKNGLSAGSYTDLQGTLAEALDQQAATLYDDYGKPGNSITKIRTVR